MPEARLKDATSLVKLQGKSRSKGKYIKKKKKGWRRKFLGIAVQC